MPLIVSCEDCSTKYRLKDSAAGKSLTCKKCGKALSIPSNDDARKSEEDSKSEEVLECIDQARAQESVSRMTAARTQAPPEAPRGKRIFGFVFSLFLHVVMLLVLVPIGFAPLWESLRARSWPHVEGVITRSDLKTVMTAKGPRSHFEVAYRYHVNAAQYTGRRICVEGHSNKFTESAHEVAARYPVKALVKVFYDPRDPQAAVLVAGASPMMWFTILMAAAMWANIGYVTWSNFRALIGKPLPETNSVNSTFKQWITRGMYVLVVPVLIALVFVLGSLFVRSLHRPRNTEDWLMAGFAFFMFGLLCGFLVLLLVAAVNSFKPAPTVSELRAGPTTPWFSTNSILCTTRVLGLVAVVVDREARVVHFKNCFRPREQLFFSWPNAAWWSCSLDAITGLSQTTYKGSTTFIIETSHGKGSISTLADNYEELRQYLENRPLERMTRAAPLKRDVESPEAELGPETLPSETEYQSRQTTVDRHQSESPRPMPVKTVEAIDWRVFLCILGGCFGPIAGMIFGPMLGIRDVGAAIFGGLFLGACSGLPFFVVNPRQLGRFVASANGMRVGGGLLGLLMFLLAKLFIQTQFMDLLVLVGAGTVLGSLFAWQRSK